MLFSLLDCLILSWSVCLLYHLWSIQHDSILWLHAMQPKKLSGSRNCNPQIMLWAMIIGQHSRWFTCFFDVQLWPFELYCFYLSCWMYFSIPFISISQVKVWPSLLWKILTWNIFCCCITDIISARGRKTCAFTHECKRDGYLFFPLITGNTLHS